jgi:CBS domain-containing protein
MDSHTGGLGLRPRVRDVMTTDVRTVSTETGFREMVGLIEEARVSALPVLSDEGKVLGIVSEADLLLKESRPGHEDRQLFESKAHRVERSKAEGTTAGEIMSSPAITAPPEMPVQEAARLMHEKRVKRLPILDADGSLVGIVSRSDLLRVYMRDDETLRRQIREDLIRGALWMDADSITVEVTGGVVRLSGQVDRRSQVPVLMHTVALVPGVVAVQDVGLSFDYDDIRHRPETPSWA